ncbi:MAG: phage protease [Pontibacterium sp.]
MSIQNHTPLAILSATTDANIANIGTVALSLVSTPDNNGWCQLLPAGYFSAVDGRPHDVAGGQWFLDAEGAAAIIAHAANLINDLVIDYEHQTLNSDKNGQPAPAAGWFKAMEWREGSGLWIKPNWTQPATNFIKNGEYRFLSAVFPYDKSTGRPLYLHSAALVNRAGLDGMQALEALRAQLNLNTPPTSKQEQPMNEALRKLLAKLGIELGENDQLTAEQGQAALSALNELKAQANTATTLATEVAALKANPATAATPDPAKYVPIAAVEALQAQVAVLSAQTKTGEVDALIYKAKDEGRLVPAMEDWARDLGKQDVAALKAYLDKAAPIAALSQQQSGGTPPEKTTTTALTAEELEAARLLGKTTEEYAALKAEA